MVVLLFLAVGCRKPSAEADGASAKSALATPAPRWGTDSSPRTDPRTNQESFEVYWDRLTYTDNFRRMVEGHLILDSFGDHVHLVESSGFPAVVESGSSVPGNVYFTRIFASRPSPAVLQFRQSIPERTVPIRGYRAPIFDDFKKAAPFTLADRDLPASSMRVAELIENELGREGLLPTLIAAIDILGPDRFITEPAGALRDLRDLGFPIDWLGAFAGKWQTNAIPRQAMVQAWAARLKAGQDLAELKSLAASQSFQFAATHPGYRAVPETGRDAIGMVRMQMGGGYHDGIVHGGSIDLVTQMVASIPEADFIVHVPQDILENVKWLARRYWPLERTNHLTLLGEPLTVAAWAQDNGKAGVAEAGGSMKARRHMTLIPRYASQEEAPTRFMPGESFLMSTLLGSGHLVAQSPLLFQGGNLLPVVDPKSKKRILLIGEAEVQRNLSLGLSREQVLEAFRVEFGVDRCVALPAASFHIDYDVTIREHDGALVAFVNDSMAATRIILKRGMAALVTHGMMTAEQVAAAQANLANGDHLEFFHTLGGIVYPKADASGVYPPEFQNLFAMHPADSSSHNMRTFLVALDQVASRALPENELDSAPSFYRDYLASLRLLESKGQRLREVLVKDLGCQIVAVPSLADVPAGYNYLNGLQDKDRYIMPVQGGFYGALDEAAAEAFTRALGDSVEIVPIISGECQRAHGAVHCAAAAYPEIESKRDDS